MICATCGQPEPGTPKQNSAFHGNCLAMEKSLQGEWRAYQLKEFIKIELCRDIFKPRIEINPLTGQPSTYYEKGWRELSKADRATVIDRQIEYFEYALSSKGIRIPKWYQEEQPPHPAETTS